MWHVHVVIDGTKALQQSYDSSLDPYTSNGLIMNRSSVLKSTLVIDANVLADRIDETLDRILAMMTLSTWPDQPLGFDSKSCLLP